MGSPQSTALNERRVGNILHLDQISCHITKSDAGLNNGNY